MVFLDAFLAFAALAHLASVALLVTTTDDNRTVGVGLPLVVAMLAGAVGAYWATGMVSTIPPALLSFVVLSGLFARRSGLRPAGLVTWASFLMLSTASFVWGACFLLGLHLSLLTAVTLWSAAGLVAVSLPSSVVQTYEAWERVLRRHWTRPRTPLDGLGEHRPFVSIHVPIHSEPPDIVIATLDRIAALDYPFFEVLVIDNNTDDPTIWEPVEAHCLALGSRFRFFHVDGLEGAKAGALNYALIRTDPRAVLIGVVDADYQVQPDWLARTTGFFADETLGFVQCPHAYRDYHLRRFGRMANTEYRVFFETSMASYNERGAALTVGTMSLVNREALTRAGGWATWCLTEDSELSIRIHALGYTSIYLTQPFGRGLIPDTFSAYKQQRFRWTYGPVQELHRHLRLFLPGRFRTKSRLTTGQRIHHGNHGLDVAMIGVRFLAMIAGTTAGISMVAHHEVIAVPLALWIVTTSVVISSLAMRLFIYRKIVGARLGEIIGALVAYHALGHIIRIASLRSSLRLPAAWQRTNKFPSRPGIRSALRAARTEAAIACACLALSAFGLAALPQRGLATMLFIGLALTGMSYLCAPITALIANHDLRHQETTQNVIIDLPRFDHDDLLPAFANRGASPPVEAVEGPARIHSVPNGNQNRTIRNRANVS